MASKTVAQLEQENRELKAKVAQLNAQSSEDLAKENEDLKKEIEVVKQHTAESEAKLTEQLKLLQTTGVQLDGGVVVGTHIRVMTPDEYAAYSKENGRVMGRVEGTKTQCSIEELRALINSGWSPKQVMDKHGIDAEEFKQLVWKLSKAELREKPINYDLTSNRFF